MKTILFIFTIFLPIFFSSCVEPEQKEFVSTSFIMTADAGEDKRIKINKSIFILGKGTTTDENKLSFLWEKENQVLATVEGFYYTPTKIGKSTLRLSVQHPDGSIVYDTMNVFTTKKEVSFEIPIISKKRIDTYLKAINQERVKDQYCGKKGLFKATTVLYWNDKLYKSAYEHTQDLLLSKTFSHRGSGELSDWTGDVLNKKSTLTDRVETYHYSWKHIGENIGAGTVIDTAQKMVKGWLESDGHCSNFMNPNFTEVGMAFIKDDTAHYTNYWTQNFGTPR